MPFFFTLRFFRLFRRLFPAAAPADPGGLRGALRLRCRLRPLEDLLKVVVQGVALDGAVFLHQGVAQLPRSAARRTKGRHRHSSMDGRRATSRKAVPYRARRASMEASYPLSWLMT